MTDSSNPDAAGNTLSRRLFVYNGGFLTQTRVRRILALSGWDIQLGKPQAQDWVGVWGKSPTSGRGETVATSTDAPILRVEDTFLRSIRPGRDGDAPIGLNLDQRGVHFDSSCVSDLEHLLATHPLDDTALMNRARHAISWLRRSDLSKYNSFDPDLDLPRAPYVLVIDQTRGDASIEHGGASEVTFQEMLVFAQTEHPGAQIIIKTHPETNSGHRPGHYGPQDESRRVTLLSDPVSPWALLEGATAVYTVSSQMGFEAILSGHKPRVFGQPFYAGWGLSADEYPVARRERRLTRAQLFAAALILYPVWYDPCRDRICELEDAIAALEAETRSWRQDRAGYVATGMRRWKHKHIQQFFGAYEPVRFANSQALAASQAQITKRPVLAWASTMDQTPQETPVPTLRVEDGFLRSRGLGAHLVAPLSLVVDDLGIYYDPSRESRLERLISASVTLPDGALMRAEHLVRRLVRSGLSKYNVESQGLADLPTGHRILVPGQVEDDASIKMGCADVCSNVALLEFTRARNPDAVIIYKPHPDVGAGLRTGALEDTVARTHADVVIHDADPIAAIDAVDEIWTMTSLLGFEALVRGKPVTCLGTPFYAGWGLSRDLGKVPVRRVAQVTLAGLVHAVLIDYPRYYDPVSKRPCPVEVVLDRLESGTVGKSGTLTRLAAKLQGMFAHHAHLWR